jgi:serine/threonine-protein kinase PknG
MSENAAVRTVTVVAPRAPRGRTEPRRTTGRTARATRQRLGAGLVEIPPVPARDPATAVLVDPQVPEDRRVCSNPACGQPVGRSREGRAGLTEGYCARCGTPYSFRPSLVAGDLIGGQYEVVGCIAHGGLGWIHLARDRKVNDKWVVLKGVISTHDPDARATALAEREFLAEIDHPNIVGIINNVEHGDEAYIVMDYVPGTSLGATLAARRAANGNCLDPIPLEHALAYVLEILPAFAYLHGSGILYCDCKPENIMHTGDAVKLIDLGAAYRVDDASELVYGTRGYQAPEIAHTGPTVASDLFTIGRTLAVLCAAFPHREQYEFHLPTPAEEPLFSRHESLYRFLSRATAFDPEDRFRDADEMARQLFGVLREVVALESGRTVTAASQLFTSEMRTATDCTDWRTLPVLIVDTDDPAAGFLASLPASAVDTVDEELALLAVAPEDTIEVRLRRARLLLDSGCVDEAEAVLALLAIDDPSEWRVAWYRGLARLQRGEGHAATAEFERVYRAVPGEIAPKLALAFAFEDLGELEGAARWYDTVSCTDSSFTSASFGLARCRRAAADRTGTLDAYARVPSTSSVYHAAQVAMVETLLDGESPRTRGDVAAAAALVETFTDGTEERARLGARVFEVALAVVLREGDHPDAPGILGRAHTETDLRFGLEDAYRTLARFAPTRRQRATWVDRANAARPRTVL